MLKDATIYKQKSHFFQKITQIFTQFMKLNDNFQNLPISTLFESLQKLLQLSPDSTLSQTFLTVQNLKQEQYKQSLEIIKNEQK
jgi:hypothetical protein